MPDVDRLNAFSMDRLSGRNEVVDLRSSIIHQHMAGDVVTELE
ncbi:hypothetical protein [Streptomyces sp. NA02950]|nr:hypothetical protein [Streptomyces sp. NA02950]